ncbi:MAG: hypothetical protein PGN24_08395 [Microbacterium arborescens]
MSGQISASKSIRPGRASRAAIAAGRQHLALRRVALYRRGHLGTVGHTAARPEMQAGLAPRGDVPQGAVVGDEPAAAALREQHDEVDRGQSHPPHDDVVAGAELREIGIGGEGGRHVLQPVTARRGDEVGGGGIRFPACVTERVHDRVGVELEPAAERDGVRGIGCRTGPHARHGVGAPPHCDTGRRRRHRAP